MTGNFYEKLTYKEMYEKWSEDSENGYYKGWKKIVVDKTSIPRYCTESRFYKLGFFQSKKSLKMAYGVM